jgi:hypothetical protein
MNFPRPGDPEPAIPNPTNPLPGATPESGVGPQIADTTPSPSGSGDATTPSLATPGDQGASSDVVDNSPIATLDPTNDTWSPDDTAAVAYDDGGFDASGLPAPSFDQADNPYATDDAYATTGSAADDSPTDAGYATADGSYASTTGDAYATADDGSTYDTTGYDGYGSGDSYGDSGSDSYGDSSSDSYGDSGADSYSYASADSGGYDGGGYDGGDANYDDSSGDF